MKISFKAQKLDTVNILKKQCFSEKYYPEKVALIELDIHSAKDTTALKNLKKNWQLTFVSNIFEKVIKGRTDKIYAVTKQNKNFEKLNHKDILGIMDIIKHKSGVVEIDYLQVHPHYTFTQNINSQIKGIGHSLVKFLKNQNNIHTIETYPVFQSIGFYEKENFIPDIFEIGKMIWKK